ncbi:MAG: hypothetical protein KDA41_06395, partial [Planctomycetales bacterium]|nr:hypothetical protein [Planctomycetales bacterium]
MANPLSFDIDADGEKARQELRKLARDNANLREEVRKLAEDSRRYSQDETTSRREVSNAIVEGAAKINLLRMAWEGVRDAVGAAIESEKEYLEYQERIRGAQQTFGEALTGAVRNLPTGVSAGQLERDIKTIAGRAKVDPTELAQNFETFLSASSGNYERSLATAEAVSKAIPFGSDARGTVGAAALDLLKTAPTGTRPEDAIGVILAAAGQARTTDIGAFADNVNAGVASLNKYGGDAASNAAIIAAMTSGATDKTGATSATASIALIEQATKFGIGGSPLEQIRALQQDADLRGRFLDSASFEKKTMATVRGLLQPGSGDASALDAALLAIPKIETAGAALDSLIKNYQSSGAIRGAMASQAGDTT